MSYKLQLIGLWFALIGSYWTYARIEGLREGLYYYYKVMTDQYNKDQGEHKLWTWERILGYGVPFIISSLFFGWASPVFVLGIAFTFPFLHDNYYYKERNKLDSRIYADKLNNQSTTSTAVSDKKELFTPHRRNAFAILGLIMILYTFVHIVIYTN
jgi:hypothetical protein